MLYKGDDLQPICHPNGMGLPDGDNRLDADYIINKLFQGKCCIISILTVCTMWIVGKRTATIKQEYTPSDLVQSCYLQRAVETIG